MLQLIGLEISLRGTTSSMSVKIKRVTTLHHDRADHHLEKLSGHWGKHEYQYSIYGLGELCEGINSTTSPSSVQRH